MCTVLCLKRTSYAFQRQPNSDGDGGSSGVQKREQRYFLSDLRRRTVIVKDCCMKVVTFMIKILALISLIEGIMLMMF